MLALDVGYLVNEFRQDPVTKQWVIVSSDRERRPNEFRQAAANSLDVDRKLAEESCPFCILQMDTPRPVARYGDSGVEGWEVCVVPNRYPVLDADDHVTAPLESLGFGEACPALGCHEVVIESPDHCESPSELSPKQVFFMLQAYRDRMRAMSQIPGVQFVLAMKNTGQLAGASLRHTHSQIFGLPIVPSLVEREMQCAAEYHSQHGRCVFCDLVETELDHGSRIMAATDEFVVWCPFASRFNFEFWLAPRKHLPRYQDLENSMLQKLGILMEKIFGKLNRNPQIDAFNYVLHSQPFDTDPQDHYHWHIEFLPRIAAQAGFEWGTGIHINTVDPNFAARELRIR